MEAGRFHRHIRLQAQLDAQVLACLARKAHTAVCPDARTEKAPVRSALAGRARPLLCKLPEMVS